jgi:hypothetical protein
MLANQIDNVDPTDIIVLGQDVDSGANCVEVSVRVLGPTRELHWNDLGILSEYFGMDGCSSNCSPPKQQQQQ